MFGVTQAEIEGTVHAGINTEYIFRGVDQTYGNGSNSMWESGVTLGTTVGAWDFGAGVWYGSVHGSDTSFDEIDYLAHATYNTECWSATLGYIYYDYPSSRDSKNLQEVSFNFTAEVWWEMEVGATYFWAVEGDNDGYSEFTLDRSFALCDRVDLGLGATLSYDVETSDVHHYGLSAVLDLAVNDVLTVSPYVSATFAETGSKNGALGFKGNDDELFGGVIVTASF